MGIVNNAVRRRNHINDPFNDYEGRISIEIRGQSSQKFPKKSYGFETQDERGGNLNVSLMGMPEENDWILYAPYSDKSLLRNVLSYYLFSRMGHYAPRTRFCELVINGDYIGLYVLVEKIKRDKNRISVAKLNPDETAGDDLTGGYIIKVDQDKKLSGGWQSPVTPVLNNWEAIFFEYDYPEDDDIVAEQEQYIQNYFFEFETVLNSPGFTDTEAGYRNYIHPGSFVDFFIINEFAKNPDAFRHSVFMFKDKDSNDGRLNMGPVWDFNLGYGNFSFDTDNSDNSYGWVYNKSDNRMYWYARLLEDEDFQHRVGQRWFDLRAGFLHKDSIKYFIDTTAALISEAQQRNFERWPILGVKVWPNYYVGETFQDELNYLETWILKRLQWMDYHIPGKDEMKNRTLPGNQLQNFPNPFSTLTTIRYNNPEPGRVSITIYDRLGRQVKSLIDHYQSEGEFHVTWDGKADTGTPLPGGIYLYDITSSGRLVGKGKLVWYNMVNP